jgi:hypothetical protein
MNRVDEFNTIEIQVINPETHGVGNKKYTDYEVRTKVCLFKTRMFYFFVN